VIRHLDKGNLTSDEWDAALDDVLSFFVKVEAVGANAGVDCCAIEETFDHFEEVGASSEGVANVGVEQN
jgi:hypothetical protein